RMLIRMARTTWRSSRCAFLLWIVLWIACLRGWEPHCMSLLLLLLVWVLTGWRRLASRPDDAAVVTRDGQDLDDTATQSGPASEPIRVLRYGQRLGHDRGCEELCYDCSDHGRCNCRCFGCARSNVYECAMRA